MNNPYAIGTVSETKSEVTGPTGKPNKVPAGPLHIVKTQDVVSRLVSHWSSYFTFGFTPDTNTCRS